MALNGVAYSLTKEGSYGYPCYKIVAQDTVTIPTDQEVFIKGRLCAPENESIALTHGLVEPDEKLMAKTPLLDEHWSLQTGLYQYVYLTLAQNVVRFIAAHILRRCHLSVWSRQKKRPKQPQLCRKSLNICFD